MYNIEKNKLITALLFLLINSLVISGQDRPFRFKTEPDTFAVHSEMDYPRSRLINRPVFISANYTGGGTLLKAPHGAENKTKTIFPYAQYANLKMAFSSEGTRPRDLVYGMPYYGIGMGFYDINYKDIGKPVSLYLLQGATLKTFTPGLRLKYEWNFGASFNWKPYDPVSNPDNKNIGANTNIYFAANIFLNHTLSKYFDLDLGLVFNHVSNGATKMPNSGVNTTGGFVGLTYHFDRKRIFNDWNSTLSPPVYENSRLISDIAIHPTRRQRKMDTEKTGLSEEYINHDFFVMNAGYALLYMPVYKYRYGVGVDFVYDESAGFTARNVGKSPNGYEIVEVKYGKAKDRFFVGLSLRGDFVMPYYTVWGQVGVNIIHGKNGDPRLYQAFGVKVPFWGNLYGSFSIRAKDFCRAEYFFLGLGYYIDHKKFPFRKTS